ncbi:MAG: saccharopine dehydrogenase NADP-binding domain-containing protein [Cytophagales bacterium]|nr:saccharopine dehydrogenase NADP-binding domain-containing protein [Cytophagales bacterium]
MDHKDILILGAGRSSSKLIAYLLQKGGSRGWTITVGDISLAQATERITGFTNGEAIEFNIERKEESRRIIQAHRLVVSLLPAHLHPNAASICLEEGKHFLTASYVSDEMRGFDEQAKQKNLLFLNECGLDPGIDHMSGMQVIDRIKSHGECLLLSNHLAGA